MNTYMQQIKFPFFIDRSLLGLRIKSISSVLVHYCIIGMRVPERQPGI